MTQPRTHRRRAERLGLSHLLVGLGIEVHRSLFNGKAKPFGTEIDMVFVAACVAIGDFEGRLMTASNVASYLDMPRATTQRKLTTLAARGIITRKGNKFLLVERADTKTDQYIGRAMRVVTRALPTR